jgi:hypothetical protein
MGMKGKGKGMIWKILKIVNLHLEGPQIRRLFTMEEGILSD